MNQSSTRRAAAPLLLFAALVLAASLPLRIWQQLNLIESGTGFWLGGGFTVYALFAAVGLLIAVPFFASMAARNKLTLCADRQRRIVEGVCALLVAGTLLIDALRALLFAMDIFSGKVEMSALDSQNNSLTQYYIRSGAIAAFAETVFGAGGAAFFLNLAFADFLPGKKAGLNRLLALAPAVWVISRVLRCFSRTIAYLNVSDLFLTLAALTALMVFFLAFAQVLSGINHEGKAWRLAAAGVPACALLLLCFVPRVVAFRLIGSDTASQDAVIEPCDLAVALFIAVFLFGRLQKQTQTEAEAEE